MHNEPHSNTNTPETHEPTVSSDAPTGANDIPEETSQSLKTHLLTKCHNLLTEIDIYQSGLNTRLRNPQMVESRSLRSSVASELKMLEKLGAQVDALGTQGEGDDWEADMRLAHALRSSNLPFYEAVWTVAKRSCGGVAAFGKRFYYDVPGLAGKATATATVTAEAKGKAKKKKSVFVDIVADDGEEWVKVTTVPENRLLMEMAKKGWEKEEGSSAGDEEERTVLRNYGSDAEDNEDDEDEIELIKLAREMRKAADITRVRYRRPRIRFVLPKVEEGRYEDLDALLDEIRRNGVTVECGAQLLAGAETSASVNLDDIYPLLPTPFKRFTSTLNVDCTLLLAIASDLSHYTSIEPSAKHHRAINRQIEIDKQQPLLPTEVWPAMDAHDLVCTEEAAKRMHEIVDVIGTETERERMKIVMGEPPYQGLDASNLIHKFQELSDHRVPAQWKLPVRAVEANSVIESARQHGNLPPVIENVAEILSDINYSVFLYGWSAGMVTISSNRTAVKQIETTVENHRDGDQDLEGPPVWVCDTARSLIGKDKNRKH